MSPRPLAAFHDAARALEHGPALESLLAEYRRGNFADPDRSGEDATIRSRLAGHFAAWSGVFAPFPGLPRKRRSLAWEHARGRRDAYLRRLVVAHVPEDDRGRRLVVNPATVFGRHARWLASRMPGFEVVGSDIDPRWDGLYRLACFWKYRGLSNYRFVRESIFEPRRDRRPAAVVFFGACGSLTDACMDYAAATASPFLICRSCCHDNIGWNTRVVRRPGLLNAAFRMKNGAAERARGMPRYRGFYFSDRYPASAYPRSAAARALMDTSTALEIAANSVDSDICRILIDLDRCLLLKERGYDVMYREELFFAHLAR